MPVAYPQIKCPSCGAQIQNDLARYYALELRKLVKLVKLRTTKLKKRMAKSLVIKTASAALEKN